MVLILVGWFTGVAIIRLAAPNTGIGPVSSSRIVTSTGGVFSKENGQVVPDWSLPNLRNSSAAVSLSQFRGHPVIVNFWASWCAPCRQEMPALAAIAQRLGGKINFVGIDTNDQRGSALTFLNKTGVKYITAFDPKADVAQNYGVYGLPTTFFISAQGKLLGRQVGAMTGDRLGQIISQTFNAVSTNTSTP